LFYVRTNCLDDTGDFVAERNGSRVSARYAGAIMRIRMTNASGFDSHQYVIISRMQPGNFMQLKALSGLNKANSFHAIGPASRPR
jgi:hypothetical protein